MRQAVGALHHQGLRPGHSGGQPCGAPELHVTCVEQAPARLLEEQHRRAQHVARVMQGHPGPVHHHRLAQRHHFHVMRAPMLAEKGQGWLGQQSSAVATSVVGVGM